MDRWKFEHLYFPAIMLCIAFLILVLSIRVGDYLGSLLSFAMAVVFSFSLGVFTREYLDVLVRFDRNLVDRVGLEECATDLPSVNYLEEVRKYAEKLRKDLVVPEKTYLLKIPVSELELNALEDLLYTYQPPKNITVLKHIVSQLWNKMVKQVDEKYGQGGQNEMS